MRLKWVPRVCVIVTKHPALGYYIRGLLLQVGNWAWGITTPPCKKSPLNHGWISPRRHGTKADLRIGTGNLRTFYRGGALNNLIGVFEKYKVDILAIQKIRWCDQGFLDKRCSVY
ncbi:hypothetical protein CDAR_253391 [Caerostris darwini]|uniref:Uncharacterized protein n=1 Tax=Caerostris darwini TaxID=1538125 RepID=A0AAV4U8S1_9ARAC|nr:hypothetical protein CDAR_253391 [Caerostris darwini]